MTGSLRRGGSGNEARGMIRPVYDFGLHPDEVAANLARKPPIVADIAAMIIDEVDLAKFGRWGGRPRPRRWTPNQGSPPGC